MSATRIGEQVLVQLGFMFRVTDSPKYEQVCLALFYKGPHSIRQEAMNTTSASLPEYTEDIRYKVIGLLKKAQDIVVRLGSQAVLAKTWALQCDGFWVWAVYC